MGAGSGIEFKMKVNGFLVKVNKNGFRITGKVPTIESFSAYDYMYGMKSVRGDLLKVVGVKVESEPDDAEWLKNRGHNLNTDCFDVGDFEAKEWMFEGYTRPANTWKAWMPFTVKGTAYVESIGEREVYITVKPADKDEFGYWFSDVFEFTPDEDDEDGDYQAENNQVNYGYPQK